MEIDTGASVSLISEKTFDQVWTEKELKVSSVKLRTYTGQTLEVKGYVEVNVEYQNQKKQLTLLVVAGDGPSLLGRDWLTHIKIDWSNLYNIQCETVDHLLEQHKVLFSEGLGTLNGYEATFQVDTTSQTEILQG